MARPRFRTMTWAALAAALLLPAACDKKYGSSNPPGPANDAAAQPVAVERDAGPAFEELSRTAGSNWTVQARAAAIHAGTEVIGRHECTRCHKIDGQPAAARPLDCVSCHVFLHGLTNDKKHYDQIAEKNGKDVVDRYIRNIQHLMQVPDLSGLGKRVRPAWVVGFLQEPYDVRPLMDESMIRNKLSADEAVAMARYFAAIADKPDPGASPAAPPPPAPVAADRVEHGRKVFTQWGCPVCHAFGNVDFGLPAGTLVQNKGTALLAPNLRFARERVDPDTMIAWILDPPSIKPGTIMPKLGMPREDAEAIRDFLLGADPQLVPAPAAADALPPAVDHKVGWAEVKERVLGKVCVHCHMNDHEKDTGPGNLGGLGYVGIGLSFRTYERTVSGAVDPDTKQRYSVLVPRKGEKLPRVLQAMLRRRDENVRDLVAVGEDHERPHFGDGLLGMPLGYPAMTDEEIGILRAWIEQGCPGPTEVSGKPGFTDGFLVPDGPIKVNRGCQLRMPADPPPKWAAAPGMAKPAAPAKP